MIKHCRDANKRWRVWGFNLGRLHVCWHDLWTSKYCLEISWYRKVGRPRVFVSIPGDN